MWTLLRPQQLGILTRLMKKRQTLIMGITTLSEVLAFNAEVRHPRRIESYLLSSFSFNSRMVDEPTDLSLITPVIFWLKNSNLRRLLNSFLTAIKDKGTPTRCCSNSSDWWWKRLIIYSQYLIGFDRKPSSLWGSLLFLRVLTLIPLTYKMRLGAHLIEFEMD